jgi:hypothetical protein
VCNAGKYAVSLVAISLASVGRYQHFSPAHMSAHPGQLAWIFFLCLGTLWSYVWDVVMDWGLVEVDWGTGWTGAGGHIKLPRVRWATTRNRVFISRAFYAWAMVSNLAGRCAWWGGDSLVYANVIFEGEAKCTHSSSIP